MNPIVNLEKDLENISFDTRSRVKKDDGYNKLMY